MKMGTGTRALNSLIKKAVSGASFDLLGSFSNSCAEIIISKNCIDNPNNYLLQERTIEI
jgi:ATP-dependent protease Clp ATPase subunit